MHNKDSRNQKNLPFINMSNSNSDTSKKNIFNESKIAHDDEYLSSSFFSNHKNCQYPLPSKKNYLLSLNSESDSLPCSLSKIHKQNKIIKKMNIIFKKEKELHKKSLEKRNTTIEGKEGCFNILNSDNKRKDECKRIKYYTPKKIILQYNIIKEDKIKNDKNVIFSNINYQGKNLIDNFKKIELDINEDNSDISFSPIPKNNKGIDKLKNELDFHKKSALGLNNFNQLNLNKKPIFINSINKNNNDFFKKEHIRNKYIKFRYNYKRNIKKINIKNKIINIKKTNKNKERIKRRSNSFNEYKISFYFKRFIFYHENNMIKNKNNKKQYNEKNMF